MFDADFYAKNYHVKASRAAEHYCLYGWRLGNRPSPFFDPKYYFDRYPDVLAARTNPLLHYLKYGAGELRSPSPQFDPQNFSDCHPYILSERESHAETCIKKYKSFEWATKFDRASSISNNAADFFMKHFNEKYYRSFNQDIEYYGFSAYEHFLRYGQFEYRNPCSSFDCYWVAKQLKTVDDPGRNVVMELYQHRELYHGLEMSKSVDLYQMSNMDSERSSEPLCRICIHVHCFYIEIFQEIANLLLGLDCVSHIVVTVTNDPDKIAVEQMLVSRIDTCNLTVIVVENRGRDIAPFLIASCAIWRQYEIVLHLHTKLSSHVNWGRDWGRYLIDQTIGSNSIVKAVQLLFSRNRSVGCVYPENYHRIKPYIDAARSDGAMACYAPILNIDSAIVDANEFAAGSMAWYRTVSLEKILGVVLNHHMFEDEADQRDFTFAHSLERLIPMSVAASGYSAVSYTTAVRGGMIRAQGS